MTTGLLLRYDPQFDVLRSLGDPPNGTLTCGITPDPDEPGCYVGRVHVDSKVDRPPAADGPYVPDEAALTDVDVEDVVAACVGKREVEMFCSLVAGMATNTLGHAIPHWDLEAAVAVIELMGAVRSTVADRASAEGWTG